MPSKPPRSKKTSKRRTSTSSSSSRKQSQTELEDEALGVIQGADTRRKSRASKDVKRRRSSKAKPSSKKRRTSSRSSREDKNPNPSSKKRKTTRRKRGSKSKRSNSGWGPTATVLFRFGVAGSVGAVLGVLFCAYATFEAAKYDVQQWIVPSPTTEGVLPAQVWSAPYLLERGTRISKAQLVDALLASGYSTVSTVEASGDFQEFESSVLIDNRVPDAIVQERVRVEFTSNGVHSIQNAAGVSRPSVQFAPMLLSKVSSGQTTQDRTPLTDIPKSVPQSILAMEDSRFYQHEGVDIIGLTRAIVVNLILDRKSQGASTITQQLVKNLILNNPEKTYKRKAREALRALALEQRLSKDELIELYMNEVYLGQVNGRAVIGVTQAAKVYFGKRVQRLTIGESAMIAGIISAPNAYSPLRHPEKAKTRRDITLKRLLTVGDIDEETYQAEVNSPLQIQVIPERRRANYFVDALSDVVESIVGDGSISSRGLQIKSTLNPIEQVLLEQSVERQLQNIETKYPKSKGVQVAAVVLDGQSGAVRALIGGRSYMESQFNRALYTKREVGSLSKPLLVAQLFQYNSDLGPGCWLKDEAIEIERDGQLWKPSNYDHQFKGEITIRDTLKQSRNLPTVMMYQYNQEHLGERSFQDFGSKVGLDIGLEPSVSLGSFAGTVLDMASAYTIFTDGGNWSDVHFVQNISERDGSAVDWIRPEKQRVISAPVAGMVTDILHDVVLDGTAKSTIKYGATGALAAKTGTTNDGRDAWLVGFDDEVVVAVWVGFDKGKSMGLGGSQAALPIWADWMASKGGTRPKEFTLPRSLVEKSVCTDWELCESKTVDWFQRGQYQEPRCALFETEQTEGLLERILPTVERDDVSSDSDSDEGGFFRLFPWGRRK